MWHVRQSTLDEAIQYEAALVAEDEGMAAGSAATTMTDATSGGPTVSSSDAKRTGNQLNKNY